MAKNIVYKKRVKPSKEEWVPSGGWKGMLSSGGKRKRRRRQKHWYPKATNSGIWATYPDFGMPDSVWERELQELLKFVARKAVETREAVRAGATMKDLVEQQEKERDEVIERVLVRLGLLDAKPKYVVHPPATSSWDLASPMAVMVSR